MAPTVTNICEPEAQGTRVTRRVELQPPGVMRVMTPLIKRTIAKSNDGFLANLSGSSRVGAGRPDREPIHRLNAIAARLPLRS